MFRKFLIVSMVILFSPYAINQSYARNVKNANNMACSLQYIAITGQTNINSFWLKYSETESDTRSFDPDQMSNIDKSPLTFNIPIKGFIFSNKCMRADFLKMVHADVYPDIPIQIVETKDLADIKDDSQKMIAVNITLAGTSKVVNVLCKVKKTDKNSFQIKGSKALSLSDFKIIAPTKFLGMVKVKDEISIAFDLTLNTENN